MKAFTTAQIIYTIISKKKKKENPRIYTAKRNLSLLPLCLGCTFIVHNGKNFLKVFVSSSMLNHKLGEFSQSRSRYYFKKKSIKIKRK